MEAGGVGLNRIPLAGNGFRNESVDARMRDGVRRSGVPAARDAKVRRLMLAQRSRDIALELALRRALHALGFRYRVDLPVPACAGGARTSRS
ncbi:DNA mismatch endonuclease Vsr [Streptomyces zhaozhouensis]|uniref:DNA mismatch endonuclease Vsr n=1 Tax=Streptomyces zhaozhouensis TaxID=1300267 RepID=A0A286DY55_9ACTN|nr:DNA mismatch endonuclease Vsr [Streptomyces zhaozhouensis]